MIYMCTRDAFLFVFFFFFFAFSLFPSHHMLLTDICDVGSSAVAMARMWWLL